MTVSAADQLKLYNGALRLVGERKLLNLSESREPLRVLNDIWDDGALDYVLEEGQWKFATRSVQVDYEPAIVPHFGYTRAFEKPEDFIRTTAVCYDPYYNSPITQYSDEAGFWFSDLDTLYIKYVSNDTDYGSDSSKWPQTFRKFFQSYMAWEICERLTQHKDKKDDVEKKMGERLLDALSKDALAGPTDFPPPGSWSSARRGRCVTSRRGSYR